MVLRKMLNKFRSPRKLQKGSAETGERNSSWQQQDGGGDSKKVRSVRVADLDGIGKPPKRTGHPQLNQPPAYKAADETPNYMKSTSSYDARKEKHQVTMDSSTSTSRIKPTKKSTTQASFKPHSLVRNSSLRLMRHSTKRITRVGLQPKINVSRATCSSTIKDSKAQKPLDLNENDVAPAKNVCPYAYCSLHGHKHGTVPSVKRFLSARGQSLKTQKSMKLRGYSSIRRKSDKEIELVEDVVTELFIEIQSKLQAHTLLQLGWRRERSRDEIDIKSMIDKINRMKLEAHHDMNQRHESCSVTSFEDSEGKNSELSMDEIQVINQFIEYIDKGWQEEAHLKTEKSEEEGEAILSSILQSSYANYSEAASLQDDGRSHRKILANCIEEEYKLSEKGSLQSNVGIPHSPRGSIKEVWVKQEAHCGEQGKDIKANFKTFGFENHVKDEADHALQLSTTLSYDTDTNSFDGLQSQKVELTDSASLVHLEPLIELINRSKVKCSKLRRQPTKYMENANEFNPRLEPLIELINRSKVKCSNLRRQPTKYMENTNEFNPRPPQFLPMQDEPEQEQVNLKHQAVKERKAAEEWMIDYALKKALRRLALARKRKVALLVAAFEAVMPQMCGTNLRCDASVYIGSNSEQTCSSN